MWQLVLLVWTEGLFSSSDMQRQEAGEFTFCLIRKKGRDKQILRQMRLKRVTKEGKGIKFNPRCSLPTWSWVHMHHAAHLAWLMKSTREERRTWSWVHMHHAAHLAWLMKSTREERSPREDAGPRPHIWARRLLWTWRWSRSAWRGGRGYLPPSDVCEHALHEECVGNSDGAPAPEGSAPKLVARMDELRTWLPPSLF